jgi:hypothetical protein
MTPEHASHTPDEPGATDATDAYAAHVAAQGDEFKGGIWWVSEGKWLRSATPGECAAEIQRLQTIAQAAREWADARDAWHAAHFDQSLRLGPGGRMERAEAALFKAVRHDA